jgi:hypothetical protein
VVVPPHSSFKLTRVRVTSLSPAPRRISLTSYARLVLGADDGRRARS